MKIDQTVKKETTVILIGELIMTAVMLAVYVILKSFDTKVLISAVSGSAVAVLNFFIMGITVQKAISEQDDKKRQQIVRLSQSLRLLSIGAVVVLLYVLFDLPILPAVIPLFFVRITILIRGIYLGKHGDKQNLSQTERDESSEKKY